MKTTTKKYFLIMMDIANYTKGGPPPQEKKVYLSPEEAEQIRRLDDGAGARFICTEK